ncbi:MSMEG_0570 family nitrogen starvation response protein [Albimonas pacifica]|uniref:Putative flavoprotein involved in K+ transport n=1 Tax=Albimonas pacifica TaxID=1114924 RepID=A0A1I3J2B9_9RHOB|nr:MSMEG_0570 family nitrogen starvation response protein [Albimonas pacifica]SFI54098.1 putative flavoprotein involved in K+ transport [Albimonas pacifica]
MPETFWTVRWPDGTSEQLYSPSSVVGELFEPGRAYPLPEFLFRARIAMERASDRVRRVHGHPCRLALGQLAAIEAAAARFAEREDAEVACLDISR